MTEYEYLDLISTYRGETGFHAMNFIAVMFGYVAAAYLVGERLTSFQVSAITALYTIFAPLPVLSAHEAMGHARDLYIEYTANFGAVPFSSSSITWASEIVLLAMSTSWIISVVFMYQSRRGRNEGAST